MSGSDVEDKPKHYYFIEPIWAYLVDKMITNKR